MSKKNTMDLKYFGDLPCRIPVIGSVKKGAVVEDVPIHIAESLLKTNVWKGTKKTKPEVATKKEVKHA